MKPPMLHFYYKLQRIAVSRWFAPPICILLFCGFLQAQIHVKQVNLAYLTQRADIIVQGQVTEVVQETLPDYPNLFATRITLSVDDMMRGPSGNTYTFREIVIGRRAKRGTMHYQVGQHLLLFLPSPSHLGFSSPIGLEQGRFHIFRDNAGSSLVSNETGNIGLFHNVVLAVSQAGRILPQNQLNVAATKHGPVQLHDFLSLVKNLSLLSRIQ
jgi:hypothetical protein